MRSHIGWRGNEAFFIRVWRPLLSICVLKTLRGSSKGESPKRTIYVNGRLGPLQDFFDMMNVLKDKLR